MLIEMLEIIANLLQSWLYYNEDYQKTLMDDLYRDQEKYMNHLLLIMNMEDNFALLTPN